MNRYSLQILEHHLDTFGHVNNATYLSIFEEARWELITRNGYGLKEILRDQKGPIILEVKLVYKREIKNRERIDVLTWCPDYKGRTGKIFQKMVSSEDENIVFCEAEFVFAFFDMKLRKIISPSAEWLAAIEAKPL